MSSLIFYFVLNNFLLLCLSVIFSLDEIGKVESGWLCYLWAVISFQNLPLLNSFPCGPGFVGRQARVSFQNGYYTLPPTRAGSETFLEGSLERTWWVPAAKDWWSARPTYWLQQLGFFFTLMLAHIQAQQFFKIPTKFFLPSFKFRKVSAPGKPTSGAICLFLCLTLQSLGWAFFQKIRSLMGPKHLTFSVFPTFSSFHVRTKKRTRSLKHFVLVCVPPFFFFSKSFFLKGSSWSNYADKFEIMQKVLSSISLVSSVRHEMAKYKHWFTKSWSFIRGRSFSVIVQMRTNRNFVGHDLSVTGMLKAVLVVFRFNFLPTVENSEISV